LRTIGERAVVTIVIVLMLWLSKAKSDAGRGIKKMACDHVFVVRRGKVTPCRSGEERKVYGVEHGYLSDPCDGRRIFTTRPGQGPEHQNLGKVHETITMRV